MNDFTIEGFKFIDDKYMMRTGVVRPTIELNMQDSQRLAGTISESKVKKAIFKAHFTFMGFEDEHQEAIPDQPQL